MSLQTTKYLNVDFYDKKYIMINTKQYDKSSRFLEVTCYNQGEIYPINAGEHSAYIRYKKPDNNSVFNFCEIDRKGKIHVELTEQMLATSGTSYVDLVIVNKGSADVDTNTGEIIAINNTSILSTMVFCIDVSESAVENSEIESSYEYDGLNEALERAEAEYTRVIQLSKSYAVGNADGIRENEDIDNAKYYYEKALKNANDASVSEANSKTYMNNAKTYMDNAKTSEVNAATSETNAQTYMNNAETYMDNAKTSETNALESETNAKTSEVNALDSETKSKTSETNAKTSETNAQVSEQNAKTSETNALDNANFAKSYAVGNTGTRNGEDEDNAQYYYQLTKNILLGLNGVFIPMGTISFSELSTIDKDTGYVYNINDDFVTDNTFKEGDGKFYPAGTNVYYTADGYWDCFGGASSPTATVDEVKNYLGI